MNRKFILFIFRRHTDQNYHNYDFLARKPLFIWSSIQELGSPVMYVDGDMVFEKFPSQLLGEQDWEESVFSYFNFPNTESNLHSFPMADFDVGIVNWYP